MRFLFPARNRLTPPPKAASQVMTGFLTSGYVWAANENAGTTAPQSNNQELARRRLADDGR